MCPVALCKQGCSVLDMRSKDEHIPMQSSSVYMLIDELRELWEGKQGSERLDSLLGLTQTAFLVDATLNPDP